MFLLHSNVDRLFAMWQTQAGQEWRLDAGQVYGDQSGTSGPGGILHPLQPWDGTVEFGAPIEPWVGASPLIEVKNSRHPSVVRPPCYDTLPLEVHQVAPLPGEPIRFVDVVEHLPTARALRLRVRGCHEVTVQSSVSAPFTVLSATDTSPHPLGFEEVDLLVWVLFNPGAAGSTASGTLTVTVDQTSDVFTVPVQAPVVPNPAVGTSLVLDTSGSMSLPSGLPAKDRMAVLHDAAPVFVSLLDDTDGVGVVRFDTGASPVAPVAPAGPMIGGAGRLAASSAINDTTTNAAGLTAIGDGLEAAAAQLLPVNGIYDSTATIVFTDGHETADKTIAMAASSVTSTVFAIGLGTADQLNPGALSDIADGTGGYLLLTGTPGVDDQLLLQKYFAQVLAGATNAAVVVDPDGFVPVGGKVVVPFDLTAADIRSDVLVLGEAVSALHLELVAPDGTTLVAGAGAEQASGPAHRVLRVVPATALDPGAGVGRWHAVLSVDDGGLEEWINRLQEQLGKVEDGRMLERRLTGIRTHGVPFTLSVQARSALTLRVQTSQPSRLPGSTALVQATLTDSGIPLQHSALVRATVTSPDGDVTTVPLHTDNNGVYRASVTTTTPGVYRLLVRAEGADLHGTRFSREELRTVAVWARGDERPPLVLDPSLPGPGRLDICSLLECLLHESGVEQALKNWKIDPEHVARCIRRSCR